MVLLAVRRLLSAAAIVAVSGSAALAADLSAYLTVTTDYVWRGVTQSDGDPAVQLGGDIAFDNGVFLGVWGSTIDINNGADRQRDNELTYYAGYSHLAEGRWTLGATVVAYTYPEQTGAVDYDYEELLLSANFDDRLWFEYAYSPDLYNSGEASHNLEVMTEWPAGKHFVLSAGLGYYDVSDLTGDGYAYWELGVTWPISRFDIDLRYHDTNRWVRIVSSADRADARVALSVRVSF